MTGYGRAVVDSGGRTVSAEIRTVNHRYLDVRVRMPAGLLALEDGVRRLVSERLHRGRVECTVVLDEGDSREQTIRVDEALLEGAVSALERVRGALQSEEPLRVADVVGIPQLWHVHSIPVDEQAVQDAVQTAVASALDNVVRMRGEEGKALVADTIPRIERVEAFTQDLARQAPLIVAEAQRRLVDRVQQLLSEQPIDPDRLAQEAALLADRADVSEELARIDSHLRQMRSQIESGGPIGRTLDFLLQELNREWNTIGSKTHDAEAAHTIVQARAELEKMREQVQNMQ